MKNRIGYIEAIKTIAKADIENGNKQRLIELMPKLIKLEKYEDCEGIKRALNSN